jgi:hypothetical protein
MQRNDAQKTQMGNTQKTKTKMFDNNSNIFRNNKTTLTQINNDDNYDDPEDAVSINSDKEETNFSLKQSSKQSSKPKSPLTQRNKTLDATQKKPVNNVNKTTPLYSSSQKSSLPSKSQSQKLSQSQSQTLSSPSQSQSSPLPSQTLSSQLPSQTLSSLLSPSPSPSPSLSPSPSPSLSPLPSQPNTPHNTARSNTSNVSTVSALTDASKSSRTSKSSNASTSSRASVPTKKFITSQNNTFEINNDKKKDDDVNYYYYVTLSNEKNNDNINDKFLIPKKQNKPPKIMEIVKQHPTKSSHDTTIIEGNYLEQTNITGERYVIVTVDKKFYKVIIKKKLNQNPNHETDIISTTKNEYTVQPYDYSHTF